MNKFSGMAFCNVIAKIVLVFSVTVMLIVTSFIVRSQIAHADDINETVQAGNLEYTEETRNPNATKEWNFEMHDYFAFDWLSGDIAGNRLYKKTLSQPIMVHNDPVWGPDHPDLEISGREVGNDITSCSELSKYSSMTGGDCKNDSTLPDTRLVTVTIPRYDGSGVKISIDSDHFLYLDMPYNHIYSNVSFKVTYKGHTHLYTYGSYRWEETVEEIREDAEKAQQVAYDKLQDDVKNDLEQASQYAKSASQLYEQTVGEYTVIKPLTDEAYNLAGAVKDDINIATDYMQQSITFDEADRILDDATDSYNKLIEKNEQVKFYSNRATQVTPEGHQATFGDAISGKVSDYYQQVESRHARIYEKLSDFLLKFTPTPDQDKVIEGIRDTIDLNFREVQKYEYLMERTIKLDSIFQELGPQLVDAKTFVNGAREEYYNEVGIDEGWQNWLDSCTPEALQIDASQCIGY